jgi:hypothetical protein
MLKTGHIRFVVEDVHIIVRVEVQPVVASADGYDVVTRAGVYRYGAVEIIAVAYNVYGVIPRAAVFLFRQMYKNTLFTVTAVICFSQTSPLLIRCMYRV